MSQEREALKISEEADLIDREQEVTVEDQENNVGSDKDMEDGEGSLMDEEEEEKVRENTEYNRGSEKEVEKDRGSESVQDGDDGLNDAKNTTAVDPDREYVVVSFHNLPQCLFKAEDEKAKWMAWPELGLNATTEKIKELLKSEVPKNILVLAYQKFISTSDVTTLERHMNEISRMASNSSHKLAIGCMYYVPQFERIWHKITELNMHIRLLNLNMGLPPCNIHKKFLVSHNRGRVHYVRPNLFAEFIKETGVGETMSYAGYVRLVETSMKFLYNAFEDQDRPVSKAMAGEVEPPPLFLSPGYKGMPVMQKFIVESGLRQPSRAYMQGGAGRRPVVGKAGPKSKFWKGQGRKPNPSRYVSKERVKDSPKYAGKDRVKVRSNEECWTNEDEMSEDELREYRRQKLDKTRCGPDADDLAGRLKDLRLKGIKDTQRNRQKEQAMYRKIRDLERECNEKEYKIREQREKIRESRDSVARIRELKDDIKEKDRKIRSLKNSLVDAERGLYDYRDAYERLCDGMDSKRRKK